MDEYLFIVLGKLRADQFELQRALAAQAGHRAKPAEVLRSERHSRRARWFNPDSELAEAWRDGS